MITVATRSKLSNSFIPLKTAKDQECKKSKSEFIAAFKRQGIQFYKGAIDGLFKKHVPTTLPEQIEFVGISLDDFSQILDWHIFYPRELYEIIPQLGIGIELCSLESALSYRLLYRDQPQTDKHWDLHNILLPEKYECNMELGHARKNNHPKLLWSECLYLNCYHSSRNYPGERILVFQRTTS